MDQTALYYIPMDRRQAMAHGTTLPERSRGAALFADISGFVPLAEALTLVHGARYGAEELTRHLNQIYDALIAPVNNYGGSVIYFSGDAITCWFGEWENSDSPAARAVSAARKIQNAIQKLAPVVLPERQPITFGVKISVTSGDVQRFVVGEPQVQLQDTLSGQMIDRLASAEGLIRRGEIVIDMPTLDELASDLEVLERRSDAQGREFAVISRFRRVVPETNWPTISQLPDTQVLPWIQPAIREHLRDGANTLHAELRPVAALFLRFRGIDFEHDENCGVQLDRYIRYVQGVLALYEGAIIQLTIGDKGSYLYIAFGAPIAHEDDPQRAVAAAMELRTPPPGLPFIREIQIGISQGTMHAGVIGGVNSRTYGVMGDEVNLAARLMQHAQPGEVLGSGRIYKRTLESVVWYVLPPLQVKGKDQPVSLARLIGKRVEDAEEFSGLLVGRETELMTLTQMLQPLRERRFAGVAYIHGEPGIGKSRVAHELQHLVRQQFQTYWFTCPPDRILRRSLYPFKAFFQEYFEQFPHDTEAVNRERFDTIFDNLLKRASPELYEELQIGYSFIAALIDLQISDSPYELSNPKERFDGSLAAVRAFMEVVAQEQPVIMQIENGHGLDSDSRRLVRFLLQHMQQRSWAMLITSRAPLLTDFDFASDTTFGVVELKELESDAIRLLARQTLGASLTDAAAQFLVDKTGGNPLFIEQLILDMRERGMLQQNAEGVWDITGQGLEEVPTSISAIFIARLDRLPSPIKRIVQMASVFGQAVQLPVLEFMLNDAHLREKIEAVAAHSIWTLSENGVVQFPQSLMRDTAYETQTQGRLQELHTLAGRALEHVHAENLRVYAAEIAWHYEKANDPARERHFARMAGEEAAARYASVDAINYLSRALKLTPVEDAQERFELLRAREEVYNLRGDRLAQLGDLNALFELANQIGNPRQRAEVAMRRANYAEVTGDYHSAVRHAENAVTLSRQHGAPEIEAAGLLAWGRAQGWQANYPAARKNLQNALELARNNNLSAVEMDSLRNLGVLAFAQGDYVAAENYQTRALELSRECGDRRAESAALTNLSRIARGQSDHDAAQRYQETALRLSREIGDRKAENSALNLTQAAFTSDDPARQRTFHEESLRLSRDIGNRRGEATALFQLGVIALEEGDYSTSQKLLEQAIDIAGKIGFRRGEIRARTALARLYYEYHEGDQSRAALEQASRALELAESVGARPEQASALIIAGYIMLAELRIASARQSFEKSYILYREMDQHSPTLEALSGLLYAAQLQEDFNVIDQLLPELITGLPTIDLNTMNEPLRFYMNGFIVLNALQDARAAQLLEEAYRLVQTRAARFTEPTQRLNYLETGRIRRAIIAARAWHDQA